MAELSITRREWRVTAGLALGEAPDMIKQHTRLTCRPDLVEVNFMQVQDGEQPSVNALTVSGPRVLKDGLSDNRVSDHFYSYDRGRQPGWLTELVGEARRIVTEDARRG